MCPRRDSPLAVAQTYRSTPAKASLRTAWTMFSLWRGPVASKTSETEFPRIPPPRLRSRRSQDEPHRYADASTDSHERPTPASVPLLGEEFRGRVGIAPTNRLVDAASSAVVPRLHRL